MGTTRSERFRPEGKDMALYTTNGVDYTVTGGGDWARLQCSICHFWVQSAYSWAWADTHARHHTEAVNVL